MTTFTTADREEEYKKILAAAPNQPGYEDAIPIPFAGWVEDVVASPPHIVDSGASVMNNEPVAWMDDFGNVFEMKNQFFHIPLYIHPAKELDKQFKKGFEAGKEEGWKAHKFHHPSKDLTDEEIIEIGNAVVNLIDSNEGWIEFAKAIIKKASEK